MTERVSIPIAKLIDCKGEVDQTLNGSDYRCHICGAWMYVAGLSPCQISALRAGVLARSVTRWHHIVDEGLIVPLPATAP